MGDFIQKLKFQFRAVGYEMVSIDWDVFWGSNLGNRDGLEAVTGGPGHARSSKLVSNHVFTLSLINFEMGGKL